MVAAALVQVAQQRGGGEFADLRLVVLARVHREAAQRHAALERVRPAQRPAQHRSRAGGCEGSRVLRKAVHDEARAVEERREQVGRLADGAAALPGEGQPCERRLHSALELADDLLAHVCGVLDELADALACARHAPHQRHARVVADAEGEHAGRLGLLADAAHAGLGVVDLPVRQHKQQPRDVLVGGLCEHRAQGRAQVGAAHVGAHSRDVVCGDLQRRVVEGSAAVLEQLGEPRPEADDVEERALGDAAQEQLQRALGVLHLAPAHRPAPVHHKHHLLDAAVATAGQRSLEVREERGHHRRGRLVGSGLVDARAGGPRLCGAHRKREIVAAAQCVVQRHAGAPWGVAQLERHAVCG